MVQVRSGAAKRQTRPEAGAQSLRASLLYRELAGLPKTVVGARQSKPRRESPTPFRYVGGGILSSGLSLSLPHPRSATRLHPPIEKGGPWALCPRLATGPTGLATEGKYEPIQG